MNNYLKIFSLFFLSVGIFFSISLFALKIYFQETDNNKLIVLGPDNENIIINASLFDLARVFKTAIDNMPVVSQFELSREPVKLEEQKDFIFKHFDGDGKLKFSIILNKLDTRMKVVVTFLAVLDLVREGLCNISQEKVFGELELQRVTTA